MYDTQISPLKHMLCVQSLRVVMSVHGKLPAFLKWRGLFPMEAVEGIFLATLRDHFCLLAYEPDSVFHYSRHPHSAVFNPTRRLESLDAVQLDSGVRSHEYLVPMRPHVLKCIKMSY